MYDILEISLINNNLHFNLISSFPKIRIKKIIIPFRNNILYDINQLISQLTATNKIINDNIINLGKSIFQLFFIDENGKKINDLINLYNHNYPLVIYLYEELENIPFELSFNGMDFLVLSRIIIRKKMVDIQKNYTSLKNIQGKSVIFIADPSNNSENSYNEGLNLYNSLKSLNHKSIIKIDFISKNLSKNNFNNILENYDWIHVSSHGEYSHNTGGLLRIGENTFIESTDLLSLQKSPELIILSACLTSKVSKFHKESIIHKLIELGINYILASNWVIIDEDLSNFILSFYKSILDGKSIGQSFFETKIQNYRLNNSHWIYFNFYGDEE